MPTTRTRRLTDLEVVEQLFDFLQGVVPDGYKIPAGHLPHLSPEQAWTVVWYVQNLHRALSDEVERCEVCGDIYDTRSGGACLDFGEPPYHFCNVCCDGREYREKLPGKPT